PQLDQRPELLLEPQDGARSELAQDLEGDTCVARAIDRFIDDAMAALADQRNALETRALQEHEIPDISSGGAHFMRHGDVLRRICISGEETWRRSSALLLSIGVGCYIPRAPFGGLAPPGDYHRRG